MDWSTSASRWTLWMPRVRSCGRRGRRSRSVRSRAIRARGSHSSAGRGASWWSWCRRGEDAMLSKAQIDRYNDTGAIVVPDVLNADEVRALSRVTDEFVARARGLSAHDEIYDLEDSHTPDNPRVRRIKAPH